MMQPIGPGKKPFPTRKADIQSTIKQTFAALKKTSQLSDTKYLQTNLMLIFNERVLGTNTPHKKNEYRHIRVQDLMLLEPKELEKVSELLKSKQVGFVLKAVAQQNLAQNVFLGPHCFCTQLQEQIKKSPLKLRAFSPQQTHQNLDPNFKITTWIKLSDAEFEKLTAGLETFLKERINELAANEKLEEEASDPSSLSARQGLSEKDSKKHIITSKRFLLQLQGRRGAEKTVDYISELDPKATQHRKEINKTLVFILKLERLIAMQNRRIEQFKSHG